MNEKQTRKLKLFEDLLLIVINTSFDCGEFVFNNENLDEYEKIHCNFDEANSALKEMYKAAILQETNSHD